MPPPPPPPGPPAPPPPLPGASGGGDGKNKPLKLKSKPGSDTLKFDAFITSKMEEVPEIVPVRPPTPPPKVPDVLKDVTVRWAGTTELYNEVQFGSQLLLIDLRDEEEFKKGHVRSAINIPWSLMKGRELDAIEDELPPRFRRRRTNRVYAYDQSSKEGDAGPASEFLVAMQADRRAALPVSAVNGGFDAFQERFPFLNTGSDVYKAVEYELEYPSMICEDFLFLGNWASAKSHEVVKHLGITHIVNATEGCGTPFEGEVRYIKCPLDDAPGANIEQYFGPCVEFIREAKDNGGRVLVHCQMGMSRSSALILLWLMHHRGMSLRDAMMYTRERRPYINPNPGFLQQLGKHEADIRGSTTIRFPPDEPVTLRTIYEWLNEDGSWVPRVVVGYDNDKAE